MEEYDYYLLAALGVWEVIWYMHACTQDTKAKHTMEKASQPQTKNT